MIKHTRAAALGAAILALGSIAEANPRVFPITYTSDSLPPGGVEVEQYIDLTPVRARSTASGAPTWYLASQLQTELEVGLAERLELGLYVTLVPHPGDTLTSAALMTEGNGFKQRLKYQLAEPGDWPIDVGLYGEFVENEREFEIETKIILQRRFGDLIVAANLETDVEFYFDSRHDLEFNPSLGVSYELSPAVHLGLEGWMRVEFPLPAPATRVYDIGPHVYLGPTLMASFGKFWWTTGAYVRLTDMGRTMGPGEPFGQLWVRTVIGVGL